MTEQMTPVPKQERWELETPYGNATVNDWRGPREEEAKACLVFDELLINAKPYRRVMAYLQTMPSPNGPRPWWNITSAYGILTPAAKRKLTGFLDEHQRLKDYLAPLPQGDKERMTRDSLKRRITREVAESQEKEGAADDLVADVLRQILDAHAAGQSFKNQWLRPVE